MTTNKIKKYFNSIDGTEKTILILNAGWLLLNIVSFFAFHSFYTSNKDKYGNIFNIKKALYIIEDPNYKHLLILGFIVIGSCFAAVIFSTIFLANSNYSDRTTKIIVIILLLLNLVIATYSIKYFIIGVVLVGLCAAGATFASE